MRISKRGARALGACLATIVVAAGCAAATAPVIQPAPSPSPTATQFPDAAPAAGALAAFAKLIARDDLTFHLEETATSTAAGESGRMHLAMDVAGGDFAAVVEIGGEKIQLRTVKGKAWARVPGKAWTRGDLNETAVSDLTNPWLYLCWLNDLEYTGHPVDHPEVFGYECKREYAYQTRTMQQEGWTGTMRKLALVLGADGTPLEIRMEGDGPSGSGIATTFEAIMTFSKVDEPTTIKPPK